MNDLSEMPSLKAATTALLVMDYQAGIVDSYVERKDELLARMTALLDAARKAGVRVIYVVVGFRPGYPEVSPRNKSFSAISGSGRFGPDDEATRIHAAVAPREDEAVVTKHRVGAFGGTDLDMLLRANDVDTLVLAGIATSGVVLSTLRDAADRDYRLVVADDCCFDPDAEVHGVLMHKVFAKQAAIASGDAIAAAFKA